MLTALFLLSQKQKFMIQFKGWNCELTRHQYSNGRLALQLIDIEDGCPVAKATVNIPEEKLEPGEIIIKDCGENEGIHDALVKANIITESHRFVRSGYEKYLVSNLITI